MTRASSLSYAWIAGTWIASAVLLGLALWQPLRAADPPTSSASAAAASEPSPRTASAQTEPEPAPLVTRNHVHLHLAGAERVVHAARAKAAEMKLKVNIAVVDDGGHLIAFARMDGARPASGNTALVKAQAAATMRAPTGPVPPGTPSPDALLNLSLQLTAQTGGGKMTVLYGGVPIVVDGEVIGAVGVGGATGEQDAEVARAGIAALLAAIAE